LVWAFAFASSSSLVGEHVDATDEVRLRFADDVQRGQDIGQGCYKSSRDSIEGFEPLKGCVT